jgi:hypothetical protein
VSALVIHFGVDDFHRIPLLKQAGYVVEDCPSAGRLHSALLQFPEPDLVAVTEHEETDGDEAASLVRSHSTSPMVLFQGRKPLLETSEFNLVIPYLTDPQVWLGDLAGLIERSRLLRSRCRVTRERTVALRKQVDTVLAESRRELERSASLRNHSAIPDPYRQQQGWLIPPGTGLREIPCPHPAGAPREPELVIGYDKNSQPVSAVCSACGRRMRTVQPTATDAAEAISWFSRQFELHVFAEHTCIADASSSES